MAQKANIANSASPSVAVSAMIIRLDLNILG